MPPEIAQHEVAVAQTPDELAMTARLDQRNSGHAGEQVPHSLGNKQVGMEHHVDPDASAPRQRDQRLRDQLQPLAPAFAPMAGDQQATAGSAVAQRRWRQPRLGAEQGIDPGVAGHMHLAADSFALKIGRGLLGRSEQQLGAGVDGSAIFLLGPGQTVIVSAKPGLNMGYRDAGGECPQRRPERARRIALHHEQVRPSPKHRVDRGIDPADMRVGILLTRAIELVSRKAAEPELARVE